MSAFTGKIALEHDTYDSLGYDLGIVESYKAEKTMQVDSMEYPDTDARWQEYFDLSGSSKRVHLTGNIIPADGKWETLLAWKENIEAFVNGYIFDNGIDIWLAVYIKDYFSTGVHLWMDRAIAPLLEATATEIGLDVEVDKLDQEHADNCPICVTIEAFSVEISQGTSPTANWSLTAVQRYPATVNLEALYL